MTGYGRGEAHHHGLKFSVELNSVNRKQADYQVDLPRELIELEPRVRDEIHTIVSRGRLHVVVAWHRASAGGGRHAEVCLDETTGNAYLRAIRKLQKDLKLKGEIQLETILRCPGVLRLTEPEVDPGEVWPTIRKALNQALTGLVKMREKEGGHLRKDLMNRLNLLAEGVCSVRRLAPAMIERYREQLHERIRKSGLEISLEDERMAREVVLFADRSDIAEELTRLESHLGQFRSSLGSREPVGRALDFLAQEISREINTISSKASHAGISQAVVAMKTELERIREQVQNVE